ncbi:YtfJ family protein [Nitratifractor sp.]
MMRIVVIMMLTFMSIWPVEVGKVPPQVVLTGKNGSRVDGRPWRSATLRGRVFVFFYVDPDKRTLNDALVAALKRSRLDKRRFGSVVVINLAATWLPNAVLEPILRKKQREFPDTLYVFDKRKVLVRRWHLADDTFDVLVLDKRGRVRYKRFGKVPHKEIPEVLHLIRQLMKQ